MAVVNADLIRRVDEMYRDLYLGDGKDNPSITTRMAIVEDTQERTSRNLNKAIWLVIGTALTVIGEAVLKFIK